MIKLYTDAATKGSRGKTGLGVLVIVDHQQFPISQSILEATNHEGEFAAAIAGFSYLKDHFAANETILYYTDSRLVSDALGKKYSKNYQLQYERLAQLVDYFQMVVTYWIPEKQNQGAHQLANQALHSH
jgi:ribonuclease HI